MLPSHCQWSLERISHQTTKHPVSRAAKNDDNLYGTGFLEDDTDPGRG
jgi:hypothetical protein